MSYGLKYRVPFRTISEAACVVNIEVKGYAGGVRELIGGATPFSIEYDQTDVLCPMRMSSGTLSVFGSDYLQDLYTPDPQGIRITLLKNNAVEWVGFVTQDTFSQDFGSVDFTYDMECVCSLSTLKHKEFDLTDDLVSFLDIIKRARDLSGYSDIYLTDAVQGTNGENIYESARIATANFFDELGEAMTYYEVLEEIAKYLGCTFTVHKNNIFLIDYLSVRKGLNAYHRYTGNALTIETLGDARAIGEIGYTGTGAVLSRLAGKNKITVNCSLYEVKNLLPNIEENVSRSVWSKYLEASYRKPYKGKTAPPTHTLITVPAECGENMSVYSYYPDMIPSPSAGMALMAEAGSYVVKVVRHTSDNVPNKLNFDTEIFVKNYNTRANALAGKILRETSPVLNLKSEKKIFVHNKIYFAFSCDVQINIEGKAESGADGLIMTDPLNKDVAGEYRMPVKLRLGNYYYNGVSWQTASTVFYIPFPFTKEGCTFGRFISSKNTNTYTMGLGGLSGFIINPPSVPIFGDIEVRLYAIYHDIMNAALYAGFGAKYTFIKNIKLEQAVQDLDGIYDFTKDKGKEDLIYESVINADYLDEADDIDLKICTNTDGKIALSSVLGSVGLLDGVKFLSVPHTGIAENGLIGKALQIYSAPRYTVNPTLKNSLLPYSLVTENALSDVKFIVAGLEEDVKMERATYNLIEL